MNYVKYISLVSLVAIFSLQAGTISIDQAIQKSEKLVMQLFQVQPLSKMKQIAQRIRAEAHDGVINEDAITTIVVEIATQDKQPEHLKNLHPELVKTDAELVRSMQPQVALARKQTAPAQRAVPAKQSSVKTQAEQDADFALALQLSFDLE